MSNDKLEAILTEYNALREEIQKRSTNQMLSCTVSIAAIGALASFLLENFSARHYILLLIPWVFIVFGFLWMDHHIRIWEIGKYIKEEIESKVDGLNWETHLSNNIKILKTIFIFTIVYFIIPPLFSIISYMIFRAPFETPINWFECLTWLITYYITIIYITIFLITLIETSKFREASNK